MSERDTYYATAQSWADERVESERRLRKLAWIVAASAGAIALMLALVIVMLFPLKTVQPYVVTVDRQSGAVEMATTVSGGRLTQNEAVIQAQLANYVRVRETFDPTDLQTNYQRTQLLSAAGVRSAYVAEMASGNPNSPLRTLSPGDTVAIRVKSVSLLGPGTALVRFDADRTFAGSTGRTTTSYASAISYGFNNKPLRMEDRFDNPLGFQVTRYRRDAEGLAS